MGHRIASSWRSALALGNAATVRRGYATADARDRRAVTHTDVVPVATVPPRVPIREDLAP